MDNNYVKEGCPAKMNNSRHFTSYMKIENIDNRYQKNDRKDEHEYRHFLQKDGLSRLDSQRQVIEKKFSCYL